MKIRYRIAVVLALASLASVADAAVFTVTKTADTADGTCDGDCSLREAVGASTSTAEADVVDVPPGTYSLAATITIASDLSIVGTGSAVTIIQGYGLDGVFKIGVGGVTINATIDGVSLEGGSECVVCVSLETVNLMLSNSVVRNGTRRGVSSAFNEGLITIGNSEVTDNGTDGIQNVDGVLSVYGSTISANGAAGIGNHGEATISSSQIANNGSFGVKNTGSGPTALTVEASTVSGNGNAGISNNSNPATITDCVITGNGHDPSNTVGDGGIYHRTSILTVVRSTISDNNNESTGGGIFSGTGSIVSISDSTISGNTAGQNGGAIYYGNGSELTVRNTTISGNTAVTGGGITFVDGGPAILNNVTITNNTATGVGASGGGLGGFNGGGVTVSNTIIAGNAPANCDFGGLSASSFNMDDDGTCGLAGTGDLSGVVDPGIAALASNGGPTQTNSLCTDPGVPDATCIGPSPAIDAGNPVAPGSGGDSCEATDQRGIARPAGAACDIGAIEKVCGDGVVQQIEGCDDGNAVNGDGCDNNCTITACGNGVISIGELCDDSNVLDGDCCSSICQFEIAGASCGGDICVGADTCDGAGTCLSGAPLDCDDGQPCTHDSCDPLTGCENDSAPAATCYEGFERALLLVREQSPGRELLVARFQNGPAIEQADFGNPLSEGGTAYALCVYDSSHSLIESFSVDRAGEVCDERNCWDALGKTPPDGRGYRFRDDTGASSGVVKVVARSGASGRTGVFLKAKNKSGSFPSGLTAALEGETSAIMQLVASDAQCVSATLGNVLDADSTLFRAKTP